MSNWKIHTTRLVRDGVKVSVMSYQLPTGNRWRTFFTVHANDNPFVPYEGISWSDAKECHDNLVHAIELMGYTMISDEFDAKKKHPMRRQPHRAQEITELP
mgnify:FL=1